MHFSFPLHQMQEGLIIVKQTELYLYDDMYMLNLTTCLLQLTKSCPKPTYKYK